MVSHRKKHAAAWSIVLWAALSWRAGAAESLVAERHAPPPGAVEAASLPFDPHEVARSVERRRTRRAFVAEREGISVFTPGGGGYALSDTRFRTEANGLGLRYFSSGSASPDFEILSVRFERGEWTHAALGGVRWSERLPGLLRGAERDGVAPYLRSLGEEGVQVFWTLARERGGRDEPLKIAFRVRAAGEPGVHAEGLMFPARAPHGRVAFSNLTAVERMGARFEAYPQASPAGAGEDGATHEIVFEVPASFLREVRWPLTLDPAVGPEFVADPSVLFGPAGANQQAPTVSWNGTLYLVAWQDFRNGNFDIYAARVAADGTVLDPAGIAVSLAADSQLNPTVASDGDGFFVAWQDLRTGTYDIYASRVTADGAVLDSGGIAVSTAAGTQTFPEAAWTGSHYFLAWRDFRSGTTFDIYAARVLADGTVLDPSGIAVSTAAGNQEQPSVAALGSEVLVVWRDGRSGTATPNDIYGRRVASDGSLAGTEIAVSTDAANQFAPSVGSDGADYLVAWYDQRNNATTALDIFAQRVSGAGTLLGANFALSTASGNQLFPVVAWNGAEYVVAWHDERNGGSVNRDIFAQRVSGAGALLGANFALSTAAGVQQNAAVASDGIGVLAVWQDARQGNDDVYAQRLASDGSLAGGNFPVSLLPSGDFWPSVASNGTSYLIAWTDFRNGASESDVYAARVALSGEVLDPSGIAVSTAAGQQRFPRAASNGTSYLIVWEDGRNGAFFDVYAARVAADGSVLDPGGIAVSTAADDQFAPSAVSDGADYLVVWHDYRSGTNYDIYAQRVSLAGALSGVNFAVSTATNDQQYAAAAWSGASYLVVWDDLRSGSNYDVYAQRVSSAGALSGVNFAVSTATRDQVNPVAACAGAVCLVVWQDDRVAAGVDDIYAQRVNADGTLAGVNFAVSSAVNNQVLPAVSSNGSSWLAVWQDFRNGNDDLYAARVAADGTALDPTGIAVALSVESERFPFVAHAACGRHLVAHQRVHADYGVERIIGNLFHDALVSCAAEVSPKGGLAPLRMELAAGGAVKIYWENLGSGLRYNIYEGDLAAPFYGHAALLCHAEGSIEPNGERSAVVSPVHADSYFLVTASDTAAEGSSGYDGDGAERNPALNTCGAIP